jgi:PKD domain
MPDGTGWPVCLSNLALAQEVATFVTAHSLPTGLTDLYFLVTPDGFGSCEFASMAPNDCSLGGSGGGTSGTPVTGSFCGFHTAAVAPSGDHILYANMPYNDVPMHCRSANPTPNGNSADITISTLSHEHNEAITDPLPGSARAWINLDGNENGDLCANNFGPALGSTQFGPYDEAIGSGHYYTQEEWSNDDGGCAARDEADTVDFSSTAPRPPGTPITFTSGAIDPDGSIVSTSWDFGDGSAAVGGTPATHVFARTGVYQVTLHIQDIGGQWAWVRKSVVVDTAPSARFSAVPSSPFAHQTVRFDAAGSIDSHGSIVAYRWTFGDGTAGSGAVSRHAFARSGTFSAVLTVTDNLGVSSSSARVIRVAPVPHVSTSLKARTLRIVVNEPGVITVGSKRKRVTRAGAVTFKLGLNRRQRHRLNSGHKVKLTLKITFVPRIGPKLTRRMTVTIHP